jgi:polyphosphate kinase
MNDLFQTTVWALRAAQKMYFSNRTQFNLHRAKVLEQKLDKMLEEIFPPLKLNPTNPTLFETDTKQ